jgi:predicted helicase
MSAGAQCFPLYWYEGQEPLGGLFVESEQTRYTRHEAIADEALDVFRRTYPTQKLTKEDIFYYIYGIFHSSDYRSRFVANLKKELSRVPLSQNFEHFMKTGRMLARLPSIPPRREH